MLYIYMVCLLVFLWSKSNQNPGYQYVDFLTLENSNTGFKTGGATFISQILANNRKLLQTLRGTPLQPRICVDFKSLLP